MIFHPSGTMCVQNVICHLEATIFVERLFCQFVVVFLRFPFVCFCLYMFLFDLFFFACLSVFTQVGPSVPKIFRDDFFTRVGPSVHEIRRGDFLPKWVHLCWRYLTVIFFSDGFPTEVRVPPFVPWAICARDFYRGDFLHPVAWDHVCPKHMILPENNFYGGEVILPTCCFSAFLICLHLYIYIFIQLFLFCPLVGFFLVFFFRCVPVRDVVRILCRIPESSAAMD